MKKFIVLPLILSVMGVSMVSARAQQQSGELPELLWYVLGDPQPDTAEVCAAVNEYIKDKVGARLRIVQVSDYFNKLPMVIAGQETFDFAWTNGSLIYQYVPRGAWLPLDNLLSQYGQNIVKGSPPAALEGAKVNGQIYGLSIQSQLNSTTVAVIEKQWLDRFNLKAEDIKSFQDLDPLLAGLKRELPNLSFVPGNFAWQLTYGYDSLGVEPGYIKMSDPNLKVVNIYATPEYKEIISLTRSWFEKGYIRADAVTQPDLTQDKLAGRAPVEIDWVYSVGSEITRAEQHGGREMVHAFLSDSVVNTNTVTSCMTSVSATSKNPELAMKFLDLMMADAYLFNLITRGIEGKHWTRIDKDHIRLNQDGGYYLGSLGEWVYMRPTLLYLTEGETPTRWADALEVAMQATPSPILGFAFDTEPVANEVANCTAVVKQYELQLITGSVDPNRVLPEFLAALEAAGSAKVIAEQQRQLDAWKLTKR
ncbi:MAG: ABC transporter substrate-binding protein [Treponema sp.]|jgi:putative aldouronate transport system substrate-binding protein|nr:ABC transporter substrate-binding protein [Treponema sp.]